jgi:hypothetical protein
MKADEYLSEGVRVVRVLIDHIESVEEMLLRWGVEYAPGGINDEEEEEGT